MDYGYAEYAQMFKALSDETRLRIIMMLTEEELCACKILEAFKITQPTLSYHMKILMQCGIVIGKRKGAWMFYHLNQERIHQLQRFLDLKIDCQEG